jgi:hypothetical protein
MIAPHVAAQSFQGAELELLDGALASPQFVRNLARISLVHKPAQDHQALVRRQPIDKLIQHGAVFRLWLSADVNFGEIVRRNSSTSRGALPPVGQGVGRDPQQPSRERRSAPLKAPQAAQSFMEDLSGHVLSFIAIAYPPRHERVYAMEVLFVELGKTAWVLLRRFNQQPLIGKIANNAQLEPPGEPMSSST